MVYSILIYKTNPFLRDFYFVNLFRIKDITPFIILEKIFLLSIKIKIIDKYIPQNDNVFEIYIKDNKVKIEKTQESYDIELDINSITQLAFSYLNIEEIFMLNEIDENSLTSNQIKLLNILFEKKVNYIDELV